MGHSFEYEHLGEDVPVTATASEQVADVMAGESKVIKITRIRVSGEDELKVVVKPFPPFPYDWEMAAHDEWDAAMEPVKPTWRQRLRAALRMSW